MTSSAALPAVSVLIPCFNAERWIGAAIGSALAQSGGTGGDVEVLVVDDGSTDGSVDVIRSFGDRIEWERQERQGGNRARNRLLERARGEWVQFLDADDALLPGKIEHQLTSARESGATPDVIYSPVRIETWDAAKPVGQVVSAVLADRPLAEQWIRWQLAQTGAVLWRTAALRGLGGWNEQYRCCQDNEVVLRAIQQDLRFHFCDRAEAVYRIWSQDTVCRRDPAQTIRVRTELTRAMLAWLASRGELTNEIRAAAAEMSFEMSRHLAASDLPTAVEYHRAARADGLMRLAGPAAPWSYRWAYRLLGFHGAERLARWMRTGRRIET